jgi:hypothetical protein
MRIVVTLSCPEGGAFVENYRPAGRCRSLSAKDGATEPPRLC